MNILVHLLSFLFLLALFPGVALGLAAIIHFEYKRDKPRTSFPRGGDVPILIGVVLTYALSLAWIFRNPYWDDNGSRTAVEFPQHFFWAWALAIVWQLVVIPVVVMIYLFVAAIVRRAGLWQR